MKVATTGVVAIALGIGAGGAWLAAIPQASNPQHSAPSAEHRVDINRASLEDLLKVPGMTRTWAGRIVRFRPYASKNELLDRGIVSGEVYNRIKDYVVAHRNAAGR